MSSATVVETRARTRASPGTRLNDLYEIDELIAVGGMGEVFRGHNIETGDAVAIKTIRPDFAGNANALALFRKEATALHTVHHGAVVRYFVFSVERSLDLPYIAMEFVTGESLADRLQRGPLPFEAVEILRRRLAGGLQAAHEAGIVHRDVSPDNVILPGGDPARAKLIDFGIARSVSGQTVIGSGFAGKYSYVSPEQLGLQGGDVTAASDIYSLGLVLAEASRGKPLDMGSNMADVVKRRSAVPDLAGVDARLVPLIESLLQPSPQRRAGSMAEVEAWRPKAEAPEPRPGPGRAGRRVAIGAGLAGLLAAAGASVFALLPPARAPVPDTGPALREPASREPAGKPPAATPAPAEEPAPQGRTEPAPRPNGSAGSEAVQPRPAREPAAPQQPPSTPQPQPQVTPPPQAQPQPRPATAEPASPPPAQQTPPPAQQTPQPTPPPAIPAQNPAAGADPGSAMERVVAFIRDYRGGGCFFLNPLAVGARAASVEGYGVSAQPFAAFDAAFRERFGFEAKIQLRQVERGQCPVVEALAAQAQAKPASVPKLRLDEDRIRSGGALRGTLDPGEAPNVKLLLVEGSGQVHDLDAYVKRDGTRASFTVPLENTARSGWRSQLVVAVGSRDPLALGEGGDRRSEALFRAISRDVSRPGSGVGLAVQYVKVGS